MKPLLGEMSGKQEMSSKQQGQEVRKLPAWQGPCSPGEVCHLHHDHAHLLGQHDDVVATVIPFGHFSIQLALFFLEAGHLFRNLCFLLLGKLSHDRLQSEEQKALT